MFTSPVTRMGVCFKVLLLNSFLGGLEFTILPPPLQILSAACSELDPWRLVVVHDVTTVVERASSFQHNARTSKKTRR